MDSILELRNCTFQYASVIFLSQKSFMNLFRYALTPLTEFNNTCDSVDVFIDNVTWLPINTSAAWFTLYSPYDIYIACNHINVYITNSHIRNRRIHVFPTCHPNNILVVMNSTFSASGDDNHFGGISISNYNNHTEDCDSTFEAVVLNTKFYSLSWNDSFTTALYYHYFDIIYVQLVILQ